MQMLYVLQKSYPAIVLLNGLSTLQSITDEDPKRVKHKQCEVLLNLIKEDNHLFRDTISSVRILSNRADTHSFLVRLGLSTKSSCDQLLEKGRILLDGRHHAVAEADLSREIRYCIRFQKYGHLATFCSAADVA